MRKLTCLIILLAAMAISCSKNNSGCSGKSFEYFNTHLTIDMDYNALVKTFGAPDGDIGSGIHIYVYKLCDGTSVMIGYSDKILYAKHVDSNQQPLHTIL
jgi:hypothetical protein